MKMTKLITFASLMLNLSMAFGQTSNSGNAQVQGRTASEAEVVQFLSKYVYELKKPYTVFHWFNGGGRNPVWSTALSASNPSGYDHLTNLGRRYYKAFCSQKNPSINPSDCADLSDLYYGRDGFYGPALYTSIDPVATTAFGGGPGWVLMQVQLPKGYRIIDTVKGSAVLPSEITNFFQQANCGFGVSTLYNLMQAGYYNLNSSHIRISDDCLLRIRSIFKDELKMDGFFYNYTYSTFQGCGPSQQVPQSAETDAIGGYQGPFGKRAFIITNPDKISPKDVKVFNSQTPDAKSDRIAIISAFDNAGSRYGQNLNWRDINPRDRDPKIDKWLQENIIGCKNEVPYGPAGGAQ